MQRATPAVVVAAATCFTLVAPVSAHGHVTVAPPFVEAGVATHVEFEVPNERRRRATTSLSIAAPRDVALDTNGLARGWGMVRDAGNVMHWSGGRITGEGITRFPARITARTPPGQIAFRVVQGYDDGKRVTWRVTLTVLPASESESPPQHLGRALTAAAAGLMVIAASLLALRRLRKGRSLQER